VTPEPSDLVGPGEAVVVRRSRLRHLLKLFYVVSAIFVLLAVSSTVDRTEGRSIPSLEATLLAFACCAVALRASASGWVSLIGDKAPRHHLLRAVYASQPGKYVPGGIMQGAGQVGLATNAGVPLRDAMPAYLVYAGHIALASLVVGSLLATQASVVGSGWALVGGLGVLAIIPVRRACVDWILRVLTRVVPRLARAGPLPSQRAMYACFGRQVLFALAQGTAFTIVLHSIAPDAPIVASTSAYAFAFGVGLLAVPVPSGLLVREGLLVAILQSAVSGGTVVTAAIFMRLITIGVEVAVIGANWGSNRVRHGPLRTTREEP
jgi:glycosyltransferase 2 family protein